MKLLKLIFAAMLLLCAVPMEDVWGQGTNAVRGPDQERHTLQEHGSESEQILLCASGKRPEGGAMPGKDQTGHEV